MTYIKVQWSLNWWPCVHQDYLVVQLGLRWNLCSFQNIIWKNSTCRTTACGILSNDIAVGAHTGRTYCILWYFLLGILTICELLIIINKLIINEILWSEQIACPALCCFKQNIVAPINGVFLSLSDWVSFHLEGVNLGLCNFSVQANCVHCPWALQPEHSGHY